MQGSNTNYMDFKVKYYASVHWLRGMVVERQSLTAELLLSFAQPTAD